MATQHFKIAWRAAWKTRLFTILNIGGLAIGFAGFILAYAYINHERSYDAWNPRYADIYLLGLEQEGSYSDMTPASLGPALKRQLPEVELAGRVRRAPFETPFLSDDDMFYVKDWLGADRSIASIFQIEAKGLSITTSKEPQVGIFSEEVGQKLFPKDQGPFAEPKTVALLNENSGIYERINGIGKSRRLSQLSFDYIAFKDDLADGQADGNAAAYQTYIMLKPHTDVRALQSKINQIFRKDISSQHEHASVYLDPLKNLHLHPKNGSNTGYKVVLTLGGLSLVILLLAGINFANLLIVQAQQRAKEIGMKKVFGVSRGHLAAQFLAEVFVQCLLAALLAAVLVSVSWNAMKTYFQFDLESFRFTKAMLTQLSWTLLGTTLVSGLYPSLILSGYHPLAMLKGNRQVGPKTGTFHKSLLTFQFVIAFLFISSMLVIYRQMQFIKYSDKGFSADQVLYIKNLAIFAAPDDFKPVRAQIEAIPGVRRVTVASNVPGGLPARDQSFSLGDKKMDLNHISVDYHYFETLGMQAVSGRFFDEGYPTDTNAVLINTAAARLMGLKQPVGERLRHEDKAFTIVGVVKDSKLDGFEQLVKPTVYSLASIGTMPQYTPKTDILVKLDGGHVKTVLAALHKHWATINPKDGKYFIYEFLDQKYAALYASQEQLQRAFTAFTGLIVLVALMGLFSMSAYSIRLREKEVGIRKVLGADIRQIFLLLNRPFLKIVGLAILIAAPFAWWGSSQWLATFAYRVDLSWWIFAVAAVIALVLAVLSVGWQALRAAVANPVDSLRDE